MRLRFRVWRLCRAAFFFLLPPAVPVVLGDGLGAFGVPFAFRIPALFIGTFAFALFWRRRRGAEPLCVALPQARRRALARVDTLAKLHAEAPLAVGGVTLCSFPAVFLALVATPFGARGVHLPPIADARWQLWGIGIALAVIVVALDCVLGLGTCARALARDGSSCTLLAATVALAVLSPSMVYWRVESRPAWLAVIAAQFVWPFIGFFLGGMATGSRRTRMSPPPPPRSPDDWMAEYGIEASHDVVLVSPGVRKIHVISAVRRLTGMGLKEAKDLIDTAPGLVMTHEIGRAHV